MAWRYNKLWIMLINKGMKRSQLLDLAGISTAALTKMGKNEPVTMVAIGKICQCLQCDVGDIVEYIQENDDQTHITSTGEQD